MVLLTAFVFTFTGCDSGSGGSDSIPTPGPIAVESVSFDSETLTLKTGEFRTLTATVFPESATDKNVTWSSDNTTVATVDDNGKVTGKAVGTAEIMVKTKNDKTAVCVVKIEPATYRVIFNANGGSSDGSATVVYNATSIDVTTHAQHTGYTLTGYWTAASGGAKVLNGDGTFAATNVPDYITGGKWTKAGDCTLYAQWLANAGISLVNKSVDVTLDYTSGGTVYSSRDSEHVTVRTDETIKLVFTSPTATGRTLEGFYAEAACTTKVAGADGTFVSNVSGYTDDSGRWTKAENCTLYAKWVDEN